MLPLPEVRVADPVRHQSLSVFPLFAQPSAGVEYLLSDEGLAAGSVTVEEVGESGSVPNLLVDNRADRLVLFLEGQELRGAKQNRVLNTSVLVAAGAKTTIPVSCVEQGRWHLRSRYFGSGSHSSSKLRYILKKTVASSSAEGRGHSSDQGEVWKEVARQMDSLGSRSSTRAMADTYEDHRDVIEEFADRLKYVEGAVGLAVALGGKVVSVDVFDRPTTCRKVWDRLLAGLVMDALETAPAAEPEGADAVRTVLDTLRGAAWKATPAVGVGEEFRAEVEGGRHASALAYHGVVVHGSLVAV